MGWTSLKVRKGSIESSWESLAVVPDFRIKSKDFRQSQTYRGSPINRKDGALLTSRNLSRELSGPNTNCKGTASQ